MIKIQRGVPQSLTDEERESCKALLVQSRKAGSHSMEDQSLNPVLDLMRVKRQKLMQSYSQYINADFVVGSTATIERLFSHAKYILSDNRCSMSLMLFELIIFLKFNNRFCDQSTVVKALKNARSAQKTSRQTNFQ